MTFQKNALSRAFNHSLFGNSVIEWNGSETLWRLDERDTNSVSNLEARTGFQTRDNLSIQAGGIKGQTQFLRNALQLQLHLRTDFLSQEHKGEIKTQNRTRNEHCHANRVLQRLLKHSSYARYLHDFRQILGNPQEEHYVERLWRG